MPRGPSAALKMPRGAPSAALDLPRGGALRMLRGVAMRGRAARRPPAPREVPRPG